MFVQTKTGSELIGQWLMAPESKAAFGRLLYGLCVAMADYARRNDLASMLRSKEAGFITGYDLEVEEARQVSKTQHRRLPGVREDVDTQRSEPVASSARLNRALAICDRCLDLSSRADLANVSRSQLGCMGPLWPLSKGAPPRCGFSHGPGLFVAPVSVGRARDLHRDLLPAGGVPKRRHRALRPACIPAVATVDSPMG